LPTQATRAATTVVRSLIGSLRVTGLDIGYAQGCAEDHVRRIGAQHLVDPQAAWRQDPATDRQYWRMHQLGDNPPPDLTKGEASARITRLLNARDGAA
jgi:hypothetical protein